MSLGDEDIDIVFVMSQERVDVSLIEELCALGLGQDEVGEQDETEVGVEGHPADDEVGPVFEEREAGQDDPVHEPWGQDGWVGGAKGFIGSKDGEEYGEKGAKSVVSIYIENLFRTGGRLPPKCEEHCLPLFDLREQVWDHIQKHREDDTGFLPTQTLRYR